MSADARTLDAYAAHATTYADRFRQTRPGRYLEAFIAALPQGALVLDLGCGPGDASAFLREAGCIPDPVDASPEMVALARERHGLPARLGAFDDLDATDLYDGAWANFSLLHAPREDLPRHLAAVHRALKPAGMFHIAMKTGTGEARDRLGRFYAFVTRDELCALLGEAGFSVLTVSEGSERGLAGTVDPFVAVLARA